MNVLSTGSFLAIFSACNSVYRGGLKTEELNDTVRFSGRSDHSLRGNRLKIQGDNGRRHKSEGRRRLILLNVSETSGAN